MIALAEKRKGTYPQANNDGVEMNRRVTIRAAGSYDRLEIERFRSAPLAPGKVRIRVDAIGVNYADCVVRMGLYASAKTYVGWPITPGFEVAGEITAIGDGVSNDRVVGERVMAVTRFGGYSTELDLPPQQVFPIPDGWCVEQAAAFPAVFLTAYYGMFELAHPRPGQTLLVHSAAGGVGGALLQLARIAECRAIGVVGASHKVPIARDVCAAAVIDKSTAALWPTARTHAPDGYDLIFDANGVSTLDASYRHLATGGKLVVYGFHGMLPRSGGRPNWLKLGWDYLRTPRFNPLSMTSDNKSVLAFNLSFLFHQQALLAEAMMRLLDWAAAEKIRPPQVRCYPFEAVSDAHRDLESGRTVGKLVLRP